jgi:hypothetical protein
MAGSGSSAWAATQARRADVEDNLTLRCNGARSKRGVRFPAPSINRAASSRADWREAALAEKEEIEEIEVEF